MLTLKMYKMKFITKSEYNSVLERYKPKPVKAKEKAPEKKQGGAVPADKKALSEVGNKFISLVANNYDRDYITYTDALNFLSIKSRNFDKVLARAKK